MVSRTRGGSRSNAGWRSWTQVRSRRFPGKSLERDSTGAEWLRPPSGSILPPSRRLKRRMTGTQPSTPRWPTAFARNYGTRSMPSPRTPTHGLAMEAGGGRHRAAPPRAARDKLPVRPCYAERHNELTNRAQKSAGSDLSRRGGPRGRFHRSRPRRVDLHDKVRDAVHCHFEEGKVPKVIRLHFVREEVISA